jgi:hypothetical protein
MTADLEPLDSEPPNTEDVVAKLEEVLAKAKTGEISSCAIAVVYRDGSSGRSWSKAHSITALQGSIALLSYAHSARYFED